MQDSSGILVNIDGSTQEAPDERDRGEDGGREETFEDASDQLASGGRGLGLEDSIAVIEIAERSGDRSAGELARAQARLEDAAVECCKYKVRSPNLSSFSFSPGKINLRYSLLTL